ncbi:hypothetical protein KO481_30040 [Nocardia sp. NEAU-G5]|uniref:Uncharacterized protein n=1 Tax=Nocardia albiluteola TaxID=2842303 RepID=A0ABS6B6I3_9NOCA|nr:hypothetical protein [Nocardia albiluteola]MBU3065753.1 hypothetical protein [Nocardia albiluteola]
MTGDQRARIIGGAFGLAFVEANAGALPLIVDVSLRGLAIAVFLGLLVTLLRGPTPAPPDALPGTNFGRSYWIVVAGEVVAGVAGIIVIAGLLHRRRATEHSAP